MSAVSEGEDAFLADAPGEVDRPPYPIVARPITDDELRAATAYVDTIAAHFPAAANSELVLHLCRLLCDHMAHGFTRDEALLVLDAIDTHEKLSDDERPHIKQPSPLFASVREKLKAAWL